MADTMSLEEIEALALAALRASGAGDGQAVPLAAGVRAAEADGIASHGLAYVPIYCSHLTCGKVKGDAVPVATETRAGALTVDAANGFAHAAIAKGFEWLIPAARAQGTAAVTIRNSYNCGVLGHHVERLAEAGLLALGFTNAPASIAPVGGRTPVVGTNPMALAVPGADGPAILIDQSASVVAKSEVMVHAREGKPIPEGWGLDADGEPTTDPDAVLKGGSMAPAGGYKGFGLGLVTEIFAACLSGATLAKDASSFGGTDGGPPATGQCFIALDPAAFGGDAFTANVSALAAAIDGQDGARLPGARRRTNRARLAAGGVAPAPAILDKVRALAGTQ